MKSLFFALLILPMLSFADGGHSYSCKSSTGDSDFFVIDLNAGTVESKGVFYGEIFSNGIFAKNVSYEIYPAQSVVKVKDRNGDLIFTIENPSGRTLVGTRFYRPGLPPVETNMPCVVGRIFSSDKL